MDEKKTLRKDDPAGWYLCRRLCEEYAAPAYWNGEKLWGLLSASGGCRVELIDGRWEVLSGPLLTRDEWSASYGKLMEAAIPDQASLARRCDNYMATVKSLIAQRDSLQKQYDELLAATKGLVNEWRDAGFTFNHATKCKDLWYVVYPEDATPPFTAPPKPEPKLYEVNGKPTWGFLTASGRSLNTPSAIWHKLTSDKECFVELDPTTGEVIAEKAK